MVRLLEMIAELDMPILGLLEIIKRIHIPGYEHAKRHFQRALDAGAIEPNTLEGYWRQDTIQLVLDFAAEGQDASP